MEESDKPSQPMTAYSKFVKQHMDQLKVQNPGMSNAQMHSYCEQKWAQIPAEQKALYEPKQENPDNYQGGLFSNTPILSAQYMRQPQMPGITPLPPSAASAGPNPEKQQPEP